MRRYSRYSLWTVTLSLLWGGSATANPVSLEVMRARQVPNSMHVQITYGVDGTTATTPLSITKDGTAITPTWTAASGFTANTGSGLVSVAATQTCDCDATAGEHKYIVRVKSAMGGTETDYPVSVTVVTGLGTPADAGIPAGDMMPWEIPEPSAIQGLDCIAACSVGPKMDLGVQDSDVRDSSVVIDSAVVKPQEDDSGCSMSGHGASATGLLVLLGLGLFLRRRSR